MCLASWARVGLGKNSPAPTRATTVPAAARQERRRDRAPCLESALQDGMVVVCMLTSFFWLVCKRSPLVGHPYYDPHKWLGRCAHSRKLLLISAGGFLSFAWKVFCSAKLYRRRNFRFIR